MKAQSHYIKYLERNDPTITYEPAAVVSVYVDTMFHNSSISIRTGPGVRWPISAICGRRDGFVTYHVTGGGFDPETMLAFSRFIHRMNRTFRSYVGGTQYTEETILAIGKEVAQETMYALEDILAKLVLESEEPAGGL